MGARDPARCLIQQTSATAKQLPKPMCRYRVTGGTFKVLTKELK
jgi:hypothetical protein